MIRRTCGLSVRGALTGSRGAHRKLTPRYLARAAMATEHRWRLAVHQRHHDDAIRPLQFRAAHQSLRATQDDERWYSPAEVISSDEGPSHGQP